MTRPKPALLYIAKDRPSFDSILPVLQVNEGGLENVLRVVREMETIDKVIYTSSFFALGPTDGFVADETQVHHEKFFCTEYERSKVEVDKIAMRAAAEGLPIVAVYPGVIYGPGKVAAGNLVARMLIERFNGRLPGYIGHGLDKCLFRRGRHSTRPHCSDEKRPTLARDIY